ncbi:hypothetical protein SAMN04488028_107200 [Reichenbachiella agariperforans]|uniref:Uncharacterized protein n=1 Tax=Reichenbachiella agariperforans TaxID=156994 RepID=A0A1M6UN25_REIAG|nr:hypothetical protein [Reichenbachiella agariperforans]SHK70665.1 hypothetical protein SAMN04488028_107200 [Reichenbachiella agariperforans]
MKTTILIVLASITFASQKGVLPHSNSGSPTTMVASSATSGDLLQGWSSEPSASSSKIKVLTNQPKAMLDNVVAVGLSEKGGEVIENTGSYLETDSFIAETESIKVKAWVDGQSIILTSQVEQFDESGFGLPVSKGFSTCTKGSSTYGRECWRTILIIANRIEGEKSYQ